MNRGEMLDLLTTYAKKYRLDANASMRRNAHMNEGARKGKSPLSQKTIDSLLVDFINFVGAFLM